MVIRGRPRPIRVRECPNKVIVRHQQVRKIPPLSYLLSRTIGWQEDTIVGFIIVQTGLVKRQIRRKGISYFPPFANDSCLWSDHSREELKVISTPGRNLLVVPIDMLTKPTAKLQHDS